MTSALTTPRALPGLARPRPLDIGATLRSYGGVHRGRSPRDQRAPDAILALQAAASTGTREGSLRRSALRASPGVMGTKSGATEANQGIFQAPRPPTAVGAADPAGGRRTLAQPRLPRSYNRSLGTNGRGDDAEDAVSELTSPNTRTHINSIHEFENGLM